MREETFAIVGVTETNPDGTDRQALLRQCRAGEELLLAREADSSYGPDAVKVCRKSGEQIGYVRTDIAKWLGPDVIDQGKPHSTRIQKITGGGRFSKEPRRCRITVEIE